MVVQEIHHLHLHHKGIMEGQAENLRISLQAAAAAQVLLVQTVPQITLEVRVVQAHNQPYLVFLQPTQVVAVAHIVVQVVLAVVAVVVHQMGMELLGLLILEVVEEEQIELIVLFIQAAQVALASSSSNIKSHQLVFKYSTQQQNGFAQLV
ncbi:MAG: hypothetical protein EBS89_00190 [Proteobacteria bacterium]|nr:hypothetical protein [Pseudomonadota bacterium]